MQLRHRVALNGAQLDELDERIIVLGVSESAPRDTLSAVSRFGGVGQRLTARHRDTLDVAVRFGLRIKAGDMAGRSELFEQIAGWAAGGGWLTLGHRPNRRLYVTCAQLPAMGDMADWTGEYSVTFRAYGVPYWSQVNPVTLVADGTRSLSRVMTVPGTVETALEVTARNVSGMEIATMSIAAGSSRINLEGLGLGPWESLVIDHSEDGLLRIRIYGGGWRSAMACRTPGSSDELWVDPGAVQVQFGAQRACQLSVLAYGRYV